MAIRKNNNHLAVSRPVTVPQTRTVRVAGQIDGMTVFSRPVRMLKMRKQAVMAEFGTGATPVLVDRDMGAALVEDDRCDATMDHYYCDLRKNHKGDSHKAYDADGALVREWPVQ